MEAWWLQSAQRQLWHRGDKRSSTPLQGLLGQAEPPVVAASREAAPAVPAAPAAVLLLRSASAGVGKGAAALPWLVRCLGSQPVGLRFSRALRTLSSSASALVASCVVAVAPDEPVEQCLRGERLLSSAFPLERVPPHVSSVVLEAV